VAGGARAVRLCVFVCSAPGALGRTGPTRVPLRIRGRLTSTANSCSGARFPACTDASGVRCRTLDGLRGLCHTSARCSLRCCWRIWSGKTAARALGSPRPQGSLLRARLAAPDSPRVLTRWAGTAMEWAVAARRQAAPNGCVDVSKGLHFESTGWSCGTGPPMGSIGRGGRAVCVAVSAGPARAAMTSPLTSGSP
jgi:hypothetical protein